MAKILSIQVGKPKTYIEMSGPDSVQRSWTSAIYKEPLNGEVWVGRLGLAGDGQADLDNHGGPDKAVFVYPGEHYTYWREVLDCPDMGSGAFGENFTSTGLIENELCVGDIFEVGEVILQISQPHQPCGKLVKRWGVKDLVERIDSTGFIGWYMRVLKEGKATAGQDMILMERPYPEWGVVRAYRLTGNVAADLKAAQELATLPVLPESWRENLVRKIIRLSDKGL